MSKAKPETTLQKTEAAPEPLRQIVQWIISGNSEADVADAIAKTWPTAKARPLIVAAVKMIEQAGEPDPKVILGFAIEATRELYRKSLECGDHQTALRALKQLVELAK